MSNCQWLDRKTERGKKRSAVHPISLCSFCTMILVCFLQRLHTKPRISPSRPAGSGEFQTRRAFALQWEQATCVVDVQTVCCFATDAPHRFGVMAFPSPTQTDP